MIIENPQEKIDKFNKLFDEGESFEKAIQNLPKNDPLIEDELKRLIKNIENYKKAVNYLENVRKNRNSFSVEGLEESDKKRKIFHDGIVSAIEKITKIIPDNQYLKHYLN